MHYLHTMIRVTNLAETLRFFCEGLGMREMSRKESEKGRFTLVFLAADGDQLEGNGGRPAQPQIELTYNWDPEIYTGGRNFGHLAFAVDDIYKTCAHLQKMGVEIHRPPRDGHMAFIRTPDQISIELLQKGAPLAPAEPWLSMPNSGTW
jgi:lactoylglutathione lyase